MLPSPGTKAIKPSTYSQVGEKDGKSRVAAAVESLGSLGQEGGAGNCSRKGAAEPAGNFHKERVMACARKQ